MKKTNIFLIFAFLSSLFFLGCSSDNENNKDNTTTVEQDKENIKASMDNFYNCLNSLSDGGFADFLYKSVVKEEVKNNVTITHPGGSSYTYTENQNWVNYVLDKFQEQYGEFSGGFKYNSYKGKYIWNNSTEKWDKGESNIVELYFPSEKGKTSNNAKLVVDSYEDTEVSYENMKSRFPTKGHLYAEIDNVKTFEITFDNIQYDVKTNFSMPLNVNVSIFTKPYTNTISFKRITPTKFDFMYNLKSTDNCGYTINSSIELNNADYGNFTKFEKDVKFVKGYFSHNDLKVTYNVDITRIKSLNKEIDKLTDSEINTVLDANVLYRDIKISDLTYDSSIKDIPVFLTYKDSSKENASKFVGNFEEKIKEIFKRFIDESK